MHYHCFTLEQRESLERLIRSRMTDPSKLLGRLHSADYGVCTKCGADIPYVRLLASPEALLCRDCDK